MALFPTVVGRYFNNVCLVWYVKVGSYIKFIHSFHNKICQKITVVFFFK